MFSSPRPYKCCLELDYYSNGWSPGTICGCMRGAIIRSVKPGFLHFIQDHKECEAVARRRPKQYGKTQHCYTAEKECYIMNELDGQIAFTIEKTALIAANTFTVRAMIILSVAAIVRTCVYRVLGGMLISIEQSTFKPPSRFKCF